jgi:hypothetical protein
MNDGTLNITNAIVFASSATEGVDIGRSNAILVTDSATTFYDTEGNNTVTLSGDYVIPESKTLTVPNNKTLNLASGTLTVNGTLADEGKGSITGGGTLTFGDFGSAAVSLATVTVNGTYTYTGSEITPDFIIAGTPLDEDEDYTVPEVSDNVDAGVNTANYTITGNGNYTGTKSGTFTIDKATPIITVPPTVNIYKGEFLPDPGTLDCEASTEGSFEWTNGNAAPEASDNYSVTFTPGDETNYDIATKTVYVMVLDRGELIALIEEAEDIESDAAVGDGHGQYPQAAHEAFAEAIKAASYVHGKAAASNTQDAINSAAETLQTAIETFNAAVISVDFDALGEKITEAKAIGRGNYTTATWNALQTAITDAEATRVTPHVTQTEIVGAFAALESAIDGLRTIYIPPPAEPDPDDTDPDDEADIPPYKTDDERAPAEQDGGGIIVPHIPDEAPRDALIVTDDGGVIPSYATTEEFPRDSAALDAQKTTFPSLALVAKDNTTVYLESKDADASFDFSAWIDSWADFFAYSDATYLGRYYIEADETGKPYFTGGDLTRLTFGNHELALFAIDGSKEAYGTWQNEPPAEPVKSGWLYENKAWYFYTDGAAKTGWLYWERNWYLLDSADGHMLVGWAYDKNYKSWFYLTGNGKMKIGWLYDNNYKAWFYLRGNGEMLTGTRSVGGKIYSFKGNGAWIG